MGPGSGAVVLLMEQGSASPFGTAELETTSNPSAHHLQAVHRCVRHVIALCRLPGGDGSELLAEFEQPWCCGRNQHLP